jgi:hypothetical protein
LKDFSEGLQPGEWDCLFQKQFCVQELITFRTPNKPIQFLPLAPASKDPKQETDPKKALLISKEAADLAAENKSLKKERKAWEYANYSHETVRQICIYESDYYAWFTYMGSYGENCFEYDQVLKRSVLVPDILICGSKILHHKTYAKIRKLVESFL